MVRGDCRRGISVSEVARVGSPPCSAPTVFYDPRALAQRNSCVWPTLTRSPIGRPRDNEVLQSGEMLKDVFRVIRQDVDPVDKVSSGSELVVNYRNESWLVCGCVDCAQRSPAHSSTPATACCIYGAHVVACAYLPRTSASPACRAPSRDPRPAATG